MATEKQIVEFISSLTVLEASELSKMLEDKWGVAAAAPVAVAAAGKGATEADEFDVVLVDLGQKKLNVIKEVRAITGLGLAESKALVESAPKAIKEGVQKAEAQEIHAALAAAGAKVELRRFNQGPSVERIVGLPSRAKRARGRGSSSSKMSAVFAGGSEYEQVKASPVPAPDLTDEEWEEAKLLAAKIVEEANLGTLGVHLKHIKDRSICRHQR